MAPLYDRIGVGYARKRQPDPRIAARIEAALGDAQTIVNVGAGAGSYEPVGRRITAVEPSSEMIRQRTAPAARIVQAGAEALPFADGAFDAAMAVLTVHHWADQRAGLAEMRRVATGPVVILTYDPAFRDFWLLDYFPALAALDDAIMPPLSLYAEMLGPVVITPVLIPQDCTDGFMAANWKHPEAYLDPEVRAAISSFHRIGDLSEGLGRLKADLDSGAWAARYAVDAEARDCGYRLVVTR
jgi:SAM-dependent methyltransferase